MSPKPGALPGNGALGERGDDPLAGEAGFELVHHRPRLARVRGQLS